MAIAQTAEQADALAKLNEARRQNGVPPLAWNLQLEKAAQRHSNDMSNKGFVDEVGSDGSSSRQRVEVAGYAQWPTVRVWGESIYAGQTNFDEALNFFLSDDAQKRALLNPRLREVAIGIAKDSLRTYWTITLGSQPNLLPIFINDGAAVTNDRQVAVQLTQEDAVPQGDTNAIGHVVEVRISDRSDFGNAAWQPWESLLPFTLDRKTGAKTIYVQMRDGTGKLTIATATITYDPNSRTEPKPISPGIASTLPPSATDTPAPVSTPVPAVPTPTVGQAASTVVVIGAPVVVDTTQIPTPASAARQSTPGPAPTPTSASVVVFVVPTPTAFVAQEAGNGSITTVVLTPLPESQAGQMLPMAARANGLPEWLLLAYLVVQAAAIMIGLIVFIRRR